MQGEEYEVSTIGTVISEEQYGLYRWVIHRVPRMLWYIQTAQKTSKTSEGSDSRRPILHPEAGPCPIIPMRIKLRDFSRVPKGRERPTPPLKTRLHYRNPDDEGESLAPFTLTILCAFYRNDAVLALSLRPVPLPRQHISLLRRRLLHIRLLHIPRNGLDVEKSASMNSSERSAVSG